MNPNTRSTTEKLVTRRLIAILKTPPAADVENKYGLVISSASENVVQQGLKLRPVFYV